MKKNQKESKKQKKNKDTKQKNTVKKQAVQTTEQTKTLDAILKIYFVPKVLISFVFLTVFSLTVFFYNPTLALVQFVLSMSVFIIFVFRGSTSSQQFRDYIESLSFDVESATHNSVLKSPFPMVILRETGAIVWYNDAFSTLVPDEDYTSRQLTDILSDFKLPDASGSTCEIRLAERSFKAYGVLADETKASQERVYVYYLIETTELGQLQKKYDEDMIIKGYIYVDNLDEITKQISDSERTVIASQTEKLISEFVGMHQGVLNKFDRDRYSFIMERKNFEEILKTKVSLLKDVKNIETFGSLPVTLSIGIGVGASLGETENFSRVALDMALGRGGDQAVIKQGNDFTYFGGQNRETEKRTKVRSRIIALSFKEMVMESEKVLIMGHKGADMDSLGSCLGLARIAKALDKPAYIVIDESNSNTEALFAKTNLDKDFDDAFVTPSQAETLMDDNTLLAIVDTHKASLTAAPDLIREDGKIFLVDHHRKGADFIYHASLTFHEPYASSTCELVVEMLQYLDDKVKLKRLEAESLYAGILIDTQNFSIKTGVRTFEAASYLRKTGMEPGVAKNLVKSDFDNYIKVSDIVKSAEIYKDSIAIAKYYGEEENSIFIAQAADDLIDIKRIEAAFVIFRRGEETIISARSNGKINVQVIMEKLGGGGHQLVAGCQSKELTVDRAVMLIKETLDEMEEV
ncbi:MAG: DHH family phosphoesterase [Clostridia bacterium]|nr:DHH family phosphoesterase [Clostridia bacterium]